MIKQGIGILAILTLYTSCYKIEEPSPNYKTYLKTCKFTINGGGFNDTISTERIYQNVTSDPVTNKDFLQIRINEKSPTIQIYLEYIQNYQVSSYPINYSINGNKNRAYLYTNAFVGDAISGTVNITKQTGEGNFNISFRNNSINPTDTIIVQGYYSVDQ